ncbi:MAG: DUF47 domain-containing protein [Deltaproteobacteria bacterium]|nr:DUF47 domain-containing protein [Deltaproteobacteria bacterium]
MFGRFMPREEKFFDHFAQAGSLIVEGAKEFRDMLSDMDRVEQHASAIKDIEHKGDEVTHRTIELLHKTFITPLDREDIYNLICKMDDILDFIEAASERMHLFEMKKATPEFVMLADICIRSAENVNSTVRLLCDLKKSEEILELCVEVNRLENEADQVLRSALAKLFREEPDTRQLIKLKEIYELLETVTDNCEDVANIIEGIVLEYA